MEIWVEESSPQIALQRAKVEWDHPFEVTLGEEAPLPEGRETGVWYYWDGEEAWRLA